MARTHTTSGKRIASQQHAKHSWTCPCGKAVHGNGGKASHQRSCVTFMEKQIESCLSLAESYGSGRDGWPASLAADYEQKWLDEADLWRERLEVKRG